MVAKTAATTEDEAKAREVWRMHEGGVKPAVIADNLGLSRQLVRDILNGRRLAPAISERSAAEAHRCPHCGKRVLSLPCLACELSMGKKTSAHKKQEQPVAKSPQPASRDAVFIANIEKSLVCKECGENRMMMVTGLVCPNGHGRIHKPIDKKSMKLYLHVKKLQSLPVGVRKGHGGKQVHVVDVGLCKKVSKRCQNDAIEVNVEGHIWLVVPVQQKA